MDFTGPKARKKKFEILMRLQAIETDVLKGLFLEAQQKAIDFDEIKMLYDFGFTSTLENNMATKKDIANFLKIPLNTLLDDRLT